jgi:hypothetical protein
MTRTKSSRALVSVVLAVLMAVAFMPAISYTSFAATAKKATKVTKVYHKANTTYTRTVGSAWTLKYKLSPSKLTTAAKKVVWKSSNKSVVSVSAKSGNKAAVSFKKAGTATVTVYTKANKKAKTSWKFKVVNAASKTTTLTGVTVSAPNAKDPASEVKVGTTLKANVAPEDAAGVTYQWYADGTEIAGATKASFTVTTDQIGKAITVKAKSKNEVESAKTVAVSTVKLTKLAIAKGEKNPTTGKVEYGTVDSPKAINAINVGETVKILATVEGADSLTDVANVQWYRVGTVKAQNGVESTVETPISGATSDTYTATKEDVGYTVEAKVTPKAGTTTTITSPVAQNGVYTLKTTKTENGTTKDVIVSGAISVKVQADGKDVTSVKKGTALTAVVSPTDAAVTYQWQVQNGASYDNVATGATYTPSKNGTYRVVATLNAGEKVYSGTAVASVTVVDKTLDSVSIANESNSDANVVGNHIAVQTAMAGDRNLKNDGSVTYKWFKVQNGVKADLTTGVESAKKAYDIQPGDETGNTVIYVEATYNGKTVKSNEITNIKANIGAPTVTRTGTSDVVSENINLNAALQSGQTGTITWYAVKTTALKDSTITATKLGTGSTYTATIANAGQTIFAVVEGSGNYFGKVASTTAFTITSADETHKVKAEQASSFTPDLTKITLPTA